MGWTLAAPTTTSIWLVFLGIGLTVTSSVLIKVVDKTPAENNGRFAALLGLVSACACYTASVIAYLTGAA